MMSLFVIMVIWLMAINSFRMTVESSSIYGDKNVGQLNRAHLKFAVSHLPPFDILTLKPDGNYTNSGISPILFNWLTEKLNFTISFYYIPDEMTKAKYGTKSDLAIVLDLFTDHVVDGSTMGVIRTPERKKVADFAYFMWTEPFTMVVPVPGEEPRLFAFIKPFQNSVWLLILIAMIVLVVLLSLFSGAYLKYFTRSDSDNPSADDMTMLGRVSSYSIYVINILTNQGNMVPGGRFSFRILVGVWLLIATVLVNSYSGTVISYLTVPKMKPPINTFEDLAISEDVELILLADNVITMQIMGAHSGTLKILADKMRRNPDNILRNIQKISESLTTSRYAFPFLKTFCNSFVASVYIKEKKCLFKATEPLPFLAGFWSLPFPKNSKYTPFFHSALMELWETGLPPFWVKNGMPRAPKCFAKRKSGENSARQGAIRLDDLSGAFLILGIGFGLATLAFLLEKMFGFNDRRVTSTTVVYVYRNATL
ncbi:glutamate receptor ionotropic, kainate 2-like [Daphnia pulex]|uniref:glutamate receptor ionotropic, kainate 2-like n=1 Tax=Daphnia pulex TaxID=6669 RepID=UPI001EDFCB44|nr:glutamate receptor ionotropic, kainate 2-like [Daphnia pulex]